VNAQVIENICLSILATTSLRGEFPPASALGEVSLASRFKASRGTAREALRVLSKQGLVEMQSRRGGAVPPRSPERAREIFSLRALLEPFAVKLA
jgi:DNA-binding GntR family transcriptional regulator